VKNLKILIVLITIIALSAVAGSIIVGNMMFEGTVNEKPYETGLLWDHMHKEKENSGLNVSIKNDGFTEGTNPIAVEILDKGSRPIEDASVWVTVSRPSTVAYDRTYSCTRHDDGSWRTLVIFPQYGYWDLKIRVKRAQSDIIYTEQVFANKRGGPSEPGAGKPDCDINSGPCTRKTDTAEILFDITPKPVKVMHELTFTVKIKKGLRVDNVVVTLEMPGMYMGENTVVAGKVAEGTYTGRGIIPGCNSGKKRWRAVVDTPSGTKSDFLFDVSY
jgi:nitrogen fixation protein FixH